MPPLSSEPAQQAPTDGAVWETRLPAVPASLDPVQDLVAELYDAVDDDLNATDRIRFESAVVEIVGNVIEHSTPVDDDRPVNMSVRVGRTGRELLGVVTDDGRAVDVDLGSASMSGSDEVGGRGLAMALALSTELTFERRDGENRWSIRCVCD